MTVAEVRLWGKGIGAVSQEEGQEYASFQYTPDFARSGIEISPLMMPLSDTIYTFPGLPRTTFWGLPGLLADSLPDRFGNALIDTWLATQGRTARDFNAVERLCYIGQRGMGALEFVPQQGPPLRKARKIEIDSLVKLVSDVLTQRGEFGGNFGDRHRAEALKDILRVGTSAGGARAKAVIAWNPKTSEIRSGQVAAGQDFEYWILKFDGVAGNKDKELEDPKGFGVIEYAYYLMAKACGIIMSECKLFEENDRRHFMTRRFDRLPGGEKLHMQSLGALAHFDYNQAGAYSYEQALLTIRRLHLPTSAVEQQFRRLVFNIVARNQDDHVKNIAFLMNKEGQWSLAPAFDMTYSYNPSGDWTATHQMTLNGKRENFSLSDFRAAGQSAILKRGRAEEIVKEVIEVVERWPEFADEARLDPAIRHKIQKAHCLKFPKG
jgi:serine/threonine-protein kinase HipA